MSHNWRILATETAAPETGEGAGAFLARLGRHTPVWQDFRARGRTVSRSSPKSGVPALRQKRLPRSLPPDAELLQADSPMPDLVIAFLNKIEEEARTGNLPGVSTALSLLLGFLAQEKMGPELLASCAERLRETARGVESREVAGCLRSIADLLEARSGRAEMKGDHP